MELVFLYIQEYRGFQKAEFHFGSRSAFGFSESRAVLQEACAGDPLPEAFWGENISNLTMLVGNNGAGKTSVMQFVIELFEEIIYETPASGDGIILLMEEQEIFFYATNPLAGVSVKRRDGSSDGIHALTSQRGKQALQSVKLMFGTAVLSQTDHRRAVRRRNDRYSFLYDCSVGNLIYSDAQKDVNGWWRGQNKEFSELDTYFTYELYKQIKFVFDKNQYRILQSMREDGYPVPVPQRLYIDVLMVHQIRQLFGKEAEDIDRILFPENTALFTSKHGRKGIAEGFADSEAFAYAFLRYQLSRGCVLSLLQSLARELTEENRRWLYEELRVRTEPQPEQKTEFLQALERFEYVVFRARTSGRLRPEIAEAFDACLEYYVAFLRLTEEMDLQKHFTFVTPPDWIAMAKEDQGSLRVAVRTDDSQWFIDFLKKYRYTCNPDYFLDFYWDLSSGENSLLRLFASLYHIFDSDFTDNRHGPYRFMNRDGEGNLVKCESMILMIDEADLTFHPEWQREYISMLTAFLPRIYPKECCRNIQILLSTHSPILLGDVPGQNVIYLKRDETNRTTVTDDSQHEGTFGQNIHLLFRDGFFLNNGTMGRFAEAKIRQLIKEIRQLGNQMYGEDREDVIERGLALLEQTYIPCVNRIAEPVVRRKLLWEIEELKRKYRRDRQGGELASLSDEEISRRIRLLRKEQDRRKQ